MYLDRVLTKPISGRGRVQLCMHCRWCLQYRTSLSLFGRLYSILLTTHLVPRGKSLIYSQLPVSALTPQLLSALSQQACGKTHAFFVVVVEFNFGGKGNEPCRIPQSHIGQELLLVLNQFRPLGTRNIMDKNWPQKFFIRYFPHVFTPSHTDKSFKVIKWRYFYGLWWTQFSWPRHWCLFWGCSNS